MKTTLAILLLALPALSSAAEPSLTKQYADCMDKAIPQMEREECVTAETERQKAQLNAALKAALKANPGKRKTIQNAQASWLKFRAANCQSYYDPDSDGGGASGPMDGIMCEMSMTAARAQELRTFAN